MKSALDNEEKPLDATIDTVMPGVLQLHRDTHSAINQVDHKVAQVSENLCSLTTQLDKIAEDIADISPDVTGKMNDMHHLQRMQLGRSFLNIASQLMGSNMVAEPSKQEEELRKRLEEDCMYSTSAAISNLTNSANARPARPPKRQKTSQNTSTTDEISDSDDSIPAEERNIPVEQLPLLCPVNKHSSLSDLFDEWFGIGKFVDEHGGFFGRNKKYKAKWRKHIPNSVHSRLGRSIAAIETYAKQQKITPSEAVTYLEPTFHECNCVTSAFVEKCKTMGLLKVHKSRGSTKKNAEAAE